MKNDKEQNNAKWTKTQWGTINLILEIMGSAKKWARNS